MRILLDARRIADFGIGTYIRNLIHSLAAIDRENQYTLITADDESPELESLPPNFKSACFPKKNNRTRDLVGFSWFLRRFPADIIHIPLNSVPVFMPRPYIVTVHDMGNILFGQGRGMRSHLRVRQLRQGLRNAACVIAVSNATRRDVANLGIPAHRIRTIYNAPDPIFCHPSSPVIACVGAGTLRYPPALRRILDRYQIHYPFLLYAGRTNPQKNIPRLVEAFAVVRNQLAGDPLYKDLRLIVIGDGVSRYPMVRHAVIKSRIEQVVRFLGFVPIETLCVFYQAAAAFVFPSLYEGFGLPPLEAMACGTPVITSHVSSLPEVVGTAASIVNPENVFDIARGIHEVLLNYELRGALIQKGSKQAKKFSWKETAQRVLETYEEAGRAGGASGSVAEGKRR